MNEIIPVKAYPIDAGYSAFSIMRSLQKDRDRMKVDVKKLATGRVMSEDRVRALAEKSVELDRRLAKRALQHWGNLLELGADSDDLSAGMKRLFTSDGVQSMLFNNRVPVRDLSPFMKGIIASNPSKDVADRLIIWQKELNKLAPNGMILLD